MLHRYSKNIKCSEASKLESQVLLWSNGLREKIYVNIYKTDWLHELTLEINKKFFAAGLSLAMDLIDYSQYTNKTKSWDPLLKRSSLSP